MKLFALIRGCVALQLPLSFYCKLCLYKTMLVRGCVQIAQLSSHSFGSARLCCAAVASPRWMHIRLPDAGIQTYRLLSTTPAGSDHSHDGTRRRFTRFKIAMTHEEKERKQKEILAMKAEEKPQGLIGKIKYYFKRYWYIAVPVHVVCCSAWFAGLFALVKSGIDVPALLKLMHVPNLLIEKVQNTPPSAGVLVVALILYKIATPARYATTLAGIQLTFWTLRRMGKLKMAKEVEFSARTRYEKYQRVFRKLNERRLHNVAARTPAKPAGSHSKAVFPRKRSSNT
uniref:DUF1279 domain-containing protein n=1 Tax=Panagrellus redivivus TaxID=6233 RepID=A0A7E4VVX3_PANRE